MSELQATTPLGTAEPVFERFGRLSIRERTDLGLASLALRRDGTRPEPFGLTLPGPGQVSDNDAATAFWMGADQWMIGLPDAGEADITGRLVEAAPGASITEQTDGWVVFEIVSEAGGDPLERLCEKLVNLPPEAMAPGRATRTLLHHMSVFVVRPETGRLLVSGLRSTAGSLHHALATTAARMEASP